MAVYSITCYYNTGFNAVNIPDSPAILYSAEQKTFPSNWLLQNKDRVSTRVNASWEQISECDYVKIGDAFYYVTGINMLTEANAELSLCMDFITTLGGVKSFTIIDGWVKRAHVASGLDGVNKNIIPEPFSPRQPLVLDGYEKVEPNGVSDNATTYVGSTVSLLNPGQYGDEYVSEETGEVVVSVPRLNPAETVTTVIMDLPTVGSKKNVLPNQTLYRYETKPVQAGIAKARSLGVDSAITSCYSVPNGWRKSISTEPNGQINNLVSVKADVKPNIPFKYGTSVPVQNNKVFSLYNTYFLLSVCSGDKQQFEGYEISFAGNEALSRPVFTCYADLSPAGAPYAQPKYFLASPTQPFQMSVKGMNWQNTPFTFLNKSGSAVDTMMYERQMRQMQGNANANQLKATSNAIGSIFGAVLLPTPGNIANMINTTTDTMQTAFNAGYDMMNKELDFNNTMTLRVPEIAFPRDESIQNYIGNTFYCYRVHLADGDVQRFDKFLTMYGYAQDKALSASDFTNRKYFNYVKAEGINIKCNKGLRYRAGAIAQLENGVRVWHTLPFADAYNSNPTV